MNFYPFQEEAVQASVKFLLNRGAVYNACEMGLGKSLQAIECCNRIGSKKVLVICPASVRLVWEEETRKWVHSARFTIFSYNTAVNSIAVLKTMEFDTLILDEAHYVKSEKAKRTEAILQHLWPRAKYRICLSGTPMTQSVADCWTIFSKIMPEFGSYWDFAAKYTHLQRNQFGTKPTGIRNADELKRIIRSNFFIRYTKAEVLKDLPEKTWQKIPLPKELNVEFTPEEKEQQERYLAELKRFFIDGTQPTTRPAKSAAQWRREQGLKKAPAVAEFCREILSQDTPLVVFTYHKDVLKFLMESLSDYEPVSIEGATSEANRKQAVLRYEGGGTNLFVGQIVAAGTGITLVRGSTAVFAELDYSPATVNQAADRLHRIGQKNPVTIYWPSVIGSIDEDVLQNLVEKIKTFEKILD